MDADDKQDIQIEGVFRLSIIRRHLSQSEAKQLHYTVPGGVLNKAQREEYEKNGFILIKNLVKPDKLDTYKARFQKICSEKSDIPFLTVMKDITIAKSEFVEGEKAITKIQDFCYDDELFEYCCLPEITDYVKSFTGPNIMAMHTMSVRNIRDF